MSNGPDISAHKLLSNTRPTEDCGYEDEGETEEKIAPSENVRRSSLPLPENDELTSVLHLRVKHMTYRQKSGRRFAERFGNLTRRRRQATTSGSQGTIRDLPFGS